MPKEIVTPEMVDLQLIDEPEADEDWEYGHHAEQTAEPESDEPCDCYERVHVETSPGRWIDKMVKRGGCCG